MKNQMTACFSSICLSAYLNLCSHIKPLTGHTLQLHFTQLQIDVLCQGYIRFFLLAHQRNSSSSLISMQCCASCHKIPAATTSLLLEFCLPNSNVYIRISGFDLGWLSLPPYFLSLSLSARHVFPVMSFYLIVTDFVFSQISLFTLTVQIPESHQEDVQNELRTMSSHLLHPCFLSALSLFMKLFYWALNTKQLAFRVFPTR